MIMIITFTMFMAGLAAIIYSFIFFKVDNNGHN